MKFKVESTGIADGIAATVATPEWCGGSAAIGTDEVLSVGLVLVERWTSST